MPCSNLVLYLTSVLHNFFNLGTSQSAPVGNIERPDRRKIEEHWSIKLYQYKLDQYELVCYNLGSPRLTGITNLFRQDIVNKDGSVHFHKFIDAIRDARYMRCGGGLGHMGRPYVEHKKH